MRATFEGTPPSRPHGCLEDTLDLRLAILPGHLVILNIAPRLQGFRGFRGRLRASARRGSGLRAALVERFRLWGFFGSWGLRV